MSSINRMMTHQLLNPEECATIRAGLTKEQWSDGLVGFGGSETPRVNYAQRQCDIAQVTNDALKERVGQAISTVNAHVFGFDLMGFSPSDPLTFMRYLPGHHFDWHQDIPHGQEPDKPQRKLSFSLQLSESSAYVGGELDFAIHALGDQPKPDVSNVLRQSGTLVVFAAPQLHRVTPIISGERMALVGWAYGPSFK